MPILELGEFAKKIVFYKKIWLFPENGISYTGLPYTFFDFEID